MNTTHSDSPKRIPYVKPRIERVHLVPEDNSFPFARRGSPMLSESIHLEIRSGLAQGASLLNQRGLIPTKIKEEVRI